MSIYEWPSNAATGRGILPFFKRLLSQRYRVASNALAQLVQSDLPKDAEEQLALLDNLIQIQNKLAQAQSELDHARSKYDHVQSQYKPLDEEQVRLKEMLGDVWRGERTDFIGPARVADWLGEVEASGLISTLDDLERLLRAVSQLLSISSELSSLTEETTNTVQKVVARLRLDLEAIGLTKELATLPLADLRKRLASIHNELDRYGEWAQLENMTEAIRRQGLDELITAIDTGALDPASAADEFSYACAEAPLAVCPRAGSRTCYPLPSGAAWDCEGISVGWSQID